MKQHFERFALYNQWANRRLYNAAEPLSDGQLWEDRGAFFGSLMGTLNHLLVGDRLWLSRLTGEALTFSLDHVLHRDFASLRQAREATDASILTYVGTLDAVRLSAPVTYTNTRGERNEQPLNQILAHVFNHQTHHRGQAHGLLSGFGLEAPVLDLIYFLRGL
ncbi:MAG TPA: DinB family protein [Patescibacteria group bacterium]|nr:DinB family protein [Patescibacteria group bacterium]